MDWWVACIAPRVGAWIETRMSWGLTGKSRIAPRVGAWIETFMNIPASPSNLIAPRVGAWIETTNYLVLTQAGANRTPRGCVD